MSDLQVSKGVTANCVVVVSVSLEHGRCCSQQLHLYTQYHLMHGSNPMSHHDFQKLVGLSWLSDSRFGTTRFERKVRLKEHQGKSTNKILALSVQLP